MTSPVARDPLALRPLGSTGLEVTGICIGAAPLGDMKGVFMSVPGEELALQTLRAAFSSPVRFLDTAAAYGDGVSEGRVGKVLAELGGPPEGYVVATKADPDAKTQDFSGEQCRRSIERSQRLLGMDFLPLVYLHDPEYHDFGDLTQSGGALDVLLDYKRQGVIGAVGIAGGQVETMQQYVELDVFSAMVTHNRFNLLNRSADALIDAAVARGMGVCNAAPYGSGILAKGPSAYPRFAYRDADQVTLDRASAFQGLCQRYEVPIATVALQFSLRDPRITSTIVGMSHPERVAATVELSEVAVPGALWEELATMPAELDDTIK